MLTIKVVYRQTCHLLEANLSFNGQTDHLFWDRGSIKERVKLVWDSFLGPLKTLGFSLFFHKIKST
jgi:hypothetical protein